MRQPFKKSLGGDVRSVALLGTFVPRRCGIATFTSDLSAAILEARPSATVSIIAVSDHPGHAYGPEVCHEIVADEKDSYLRAAEVVNRHDVLLVQHEYGIYGGPAGAHLLSLLKGTNVPIVTTLHTVLRNPSFAQRLVMDELLQLSERIVVMSELAVTILQETHGVQPEKVEVVPHGVPVVDPKVGQAFRKKLGLPAPMLLTFGLLSKGKGIDTVIRAMPGILAKQPAACYVVLGATHPHVLETEGERYRHDLVQLAAELGVSDHVRFVDQYVDQAELVAYLGATDIYVTASTDPNQIASGTLAYALGSGKSVISTAYSYAREVLADGRGVLVPFNEPHAISEAVNRLHELPATARDMANRARKYSRRMLWSEVGRSYLTLLDEARQSARLHLKILVGPILAKEYPVLDLPELNLDHLRRMTDDTGLLQHSTFTIPNREHGYCVDDNARGLALTAMLAAPGEACRSEAVALARGYLSFLNHALPEGGNRFRNFMTYDRRWTEEAGSDDCQGRALWGMGTLISSHLSDLHELGKSLFDRVIGSVPDLTSIRSWAYAILGADLYLSRFPDEKPVADIVDILATRIQQHLNHHTVREWRWFEPKVAYANARLPQALIVAGLRRGQPRFVEDGLSALRWLRGVQSSENGDFAPIGTNGYMCADGRSESFDQQPIEAAATVSACLVAEVATNDSEWRNSAHNAFAWFTGKNALGQSLYDPDSGGCRDGLHPDRVNQNQGAESTLSFLTALSEMRSRMIIAVAPPAARLAI